MNRRSLRFNFLVVTALVFLAPTGSNAAETTQLFFGTKTETKQTLMTLTNRDIQPDLESNKKELDQMARSKIESDDMTAFAFHKGVLFGPSLVWNFAKQVSVDHRTYSTAIQPLQMDFASGDRIGRDPMIDPTAWPMDYPNVRSFDGLYVFNMITVAVSGHWQIATPLVLAGIRLELEGPRKRILRNRYYETQELVVNQSATGLLVQLSPQEVKQIYRDCFRLGVGLAELKATLTLHTPARDPHVTIELNNKDTLQLLRIEKGMQRFLFALERWLPSWCQRLLIGQ